MRISGGRYRGRTVSVPRGARPTGGRVREALFSILGPQIVGSTFLDLFAGSGGVGVEALSRGADRALMVERPGKNIQLLNRNCQDVLTGDEEWTVMALDIPRGLSKIPDHGSWAIVFADPPYAFTETEALVAGVVPLVSADGVFVLEHSSRDSVAAPAGVFDLLDYREYGESALSFLTPCR